MTLDQPNEVQCISCRSKESSIWRTRRDTDRIFDEIFYMYKCSQCGLYYLSPSPDDMDKFYNDSFYGAGSNKASRAFRLSQRIFQYLRAQIVLKHKRGGKLLDIGCGDGEFLMKMRALGFDVAGMEFSDSGAQVAGQKLGMEIFHGDMESKKLEKLAPFDVITLWHVLEHTPNPREVLNSARNLIADDGILAIGLPNAESVQSRLFRNNWFHLDIPRHIVHFTLESINGLLEEEGFEVVEVKNFSFEFGPVGFVQSALNALGIQFNMLHNMARRGMDYRGVLSPSRRMTDMFLTYTLSALLAAPSLALEYIFSLSGKGGTFDLVAKPREPA